ncbi:class I SAM-dependent methyltransferase [Natrinema sp. SYSU A 869]|uniref:class I SAM-dependent methyltransferase n=1 Tax=Natrinema sp. SYSU A 869 TaxID=2871694 RepID=UPI001CA4049F|nr:class I SAM-dependent methyltransferase [Natrinema sp. SYSU A 869]
MAQEVSSPEEHAKFVWSLGSYSDIAPHFLSMAARLVDATDVNSDDTVLDVGCGTGNIAITAARRGASVTGLDITPTMLEKAKENAAVASVEDISWHEGTATDLPFDDDAFDITLSCVGHMFADPPDAAAQELLRVTRSGGQIAFTSWTPASVVPAMGKTLTEYLPPKPDAPVPPFLWGDPDVVRKRLGDNVDELVFETGTVLTPVLSPEHYWEAAVTQSGMFIVALENIDEDDLPALREEMIETIEQYFDDSQNAVPMEYCLTTAVVG